MALYIIRGSYKKLDIHILPHLDVDPQQLVPCVVIERALANDCLGIVEQLNTVAGSHWRYTCSGKIGLGYHAVPNLQVLHYMSVRDIPT